MKLKTEFVCLISILIIAEISSNGDIYTSINGLQNLLWTEEELLKTLDLYISFEESKLNKIKKIRSDYEEQYFDATEDAEKYLAHPLNAYRLVKKLTTDWKNVLTMIGDKTAEDIIMNVTNHDYLIWPSDEDLNGVATAVTRLQDTYKLETGLIASGKLELSSDLKNGVSYGTSLSANDCFELGRQMYNSGDHYHTVLWMNEALTKYETEDPKTVDKWEILEYLAFSSYMDGNIRRALLFTNELLQIYPDHPRADRNRIYYEETLLNQGTEIKRKGEDELGDIEEEGLKEGFEGIDEEKNLYTRLCRGENLISDQDRAKLFCNYYAPHPYFFIGPVKREIHWLKPKIVVYHDIISDAEIETVRELAVPKFQRATVQNYKTGELETATYRISKTGWLKSEDHPHIRTVNRRIEAITGLNEATAEELQVSNYGIGGHYEPHYDFARREEKDAFKSLGTGNRIATYMHYMSDVELGGATVFPSIGVSLWPKKGSAAFWFNLFTNGTGDDLTRHAACPVLAGSKWVSNKWFHEYGQEFLRPCALQSESH